MIGSEDHSTIAETYQLYGAHPQSALQVTYGVLCTSWYGVPAKPLPFVSIRPIEALPLPVVLGTPYLGT